MQGNNNRKLGAIALSLTLLVALTALAGACRALADAVVSTVAVGSDPQAIAVNSATDQVYVVNNDNVHRTVTVIDGRVPDPSAGWVPQSDGTTTVPMGLDFGPIAINPATDRIYVANANGGSQGTVTVINGSDNSTATGLVYVGNCGDNTVTVIDGAVPSAVQKSVSFTVGRNSCNDNGQTLSLAGAPLMVDGRLLAPVRSLDDALGALTTWDAHRRAVSIIKGNTGLELVIGSATLNDNGRVSWMDTVPVIIDGRAYFPLRYVAEALGCQVDWDQASQTATVTYSAGIPDLPLLHGGTGPGPLTGENTSLGGIHLGDRQSQVLALYGAPTTKSSAHGTPFPLWYYQQGDMYVDFYTTGGPAASDPLAEDVWLDENSSLHTDKGIGIGSTLAEILDSYGPVGSTAVDTVDGARFRNIWFYGPNKETLGQQTLYYPYIQFTLKNDRVIEIYLSDAENKPQ